MASSSHAPMGRVAKAYLLLRRMLGLSPGWLRHDGYRPEQHYMRGPGPKTLSRQASRQGSRERASNSS